MRPLEERIGFVRGEGARADLGTQPDLGRQLRGHTSITQKFSHSFSFTEEILRMWVIPLTAVEGHGEWLLSARCSAIATANGRIQNLGKILHKLNQGRKPAAVLQLMLSSGAAFSRGQCTS